MKKLIFIAIFSLFSIYSFANSGSVNNRVEKAIETLPISKKHGLNFLKEIKLDEVYTASFNFVKNENTLYDCEIAIKGTFEGTKVDIVVTIYDVSWASCQALRTAVKLYIATH